MSTTDLTDLEHRRRAVARALSVASVHPKPPAVAPPPAPDPHISRIEQLERAIAELRLQITHAMRRIDDLDQPGLNAYPPVEIESEQQRPRLMSDAAAVALFGHV